MKSKKIFVLLSALALSLAACTPKGGKTSTSQGGNDSTSQQGSASTTSQGGNTQSSQQGGNSTSLSVTYPTIAGCYTDTGTMAHSPSHVLGRSTRTPLETVPQSPL